ncbi:protein CURVATURE THYLAKOID 1A, chloroplastic-like isoform X1 [Sesamum indicum]|uniref:Protein CURVATURE THYLAKOID 1A, chloroplastic-like isoform X1 n=2 Tax=Sesamum indicum TaxID=4182 RepID=A0A6I9UGF2_SESIN|nr:protein CURVATURE THYLAKOID 1A, chloroplastic-like isoform X1 [Sesamum indicum]
MAMAVAASTSMAATAVLMHRFPATKPSAGFFPLPQRPSLSSTPFNQLKETRRSSQLLVKASSSDESSIDTNELFSDLKEKWDAVENKTTVIIYGGGAIVAVWLASTLVGAVNSVPLLPKIMELVGLGYTGWFVYRYLLFKQSRKELATDIEAIKKKIAGSE